DVRAVEQVDAGIEADVDQPGRLGHVGSTPGTEQRARAAECTGAEAECGHLEAGVAQIAVFHGDVLAKVRARLPRTPWWPSVAMALHPAARCTAPRPVRATAATRRPRSRRPGRDRG